MKKLVVLFSCLFLIYLNDTLLGQQPWLTNGNSVGGSAFFGTTNNEPILFEVNSHQAMVILANGNVGIGTTDPHYTLQVVGDVVDSGSFFATNIATSNSISVGQFRIVDGVIDSIVSPAGILQLSAATVNANGTFTAEQTITAGTSDTAITINGDAGTITSGLQKISFGNDTIVTTATIKAQNFLAPYFSADSIQVSQINPKDSIIYFGDPSMSLTLPRAMSSEESNNLIVTCAGPEKWNSNCGFSFNSGATPSCPRFGLGTTDMQAELDIEDAPNGLPAILVGQGKVVIGSGLNFNTYTNYGLYVGNGILTSVVKIALPSDNINWSDYVFGNNYKLKPLTEVAKYIKENKHLPDVPSAADVKKDGINVADMDATLLKKIEELTLYMIEQQKQSDRQQKEIQDLKSQLGKLQSKQK